MKNKTDSKEKMLTAATRLFQVKGYNATGLKEILEESNSPKGSLYYYFPNGKEELALEAIRLASEAIKRKIKCTLDKFSKPIDGFQAIIDNMIEDLGKEGKLQEISISLIALETYLSSEKLSNACKEVFLDLERVFEERLIEGGYSKEIAHELGMVIQAMIEGAITMSVVKKNAESFLAVSKQISMLLNHYI